MNEKRKRPPFGQRVKATSWAYKNREKKCNPHARADWERFYATRMTWEQYENKYGKLYTTWKREECPAFEGLYIGFRIVHEGYLEHDVEYGYGGAKPSESHYFVRQSSREVWLIVSNERRNPIHVFADEAIWEEIHATP